MCDMGEGSAYWHMERNNRKLQQQLEFTQHRLDDAIEAIDKLQCQLGIMDKPTGTVQRWNAYVDTSACLLSVDWVKDETGKYVTYDDHKAAMDALAAQAVALAQTVVMLCEKHGHTDYPSYQQAQAILDTQGKKE